MQYKYIYIIVLSNAMNRIQNTFLFTYVCVLCIFIMCMCVCVCVYIYIYTHMHVYISKKKYLYILKIIITFELYKYIDMYITIYYISTYRYVNTCQYFQNIYCKYMLCYMLIYSANKNLFRMRFIAFKCLTALIYMYVKFIHIY